MESTRAKRTRETLAISHRIRLIFAVSCFHTKQRGAQHNHALRRVECASY